MESASTSMPSADTPSRSSASFNAPSLDTSMSGSTPTPSQFGFVTGFSARPPGTKIARPAPSGIMPPGLAPPPVVVPTISPSFLTFMSYANPSPPENVAALVSTYTGLPANENGTVSLQNS